MRVKTAVPRHKRRRRLMKAVSGFRGTPNNRLRRAKDSAQRSMNYMFDGRKIKKRNYRAMWIVRINAAVRPLGMDYSEFMGALVKASIEIDRKVLADLAVSEPAAFTRVVEMARAALK
ncbi:MAG: 50S ribosomal protein L20 [Planctomycetes bacterium]|nr:50S ribosomal protein L20 [Planctomycetota bacterium]